MVMKSKIVNKELRSIWLSDMIQNSMGIKRTLFVNFEDQLVNLFRLRGIVSDCCKLCDFELYNTNDFGNICFSNISFPQFKNIVAPKLNSKYSQQNLSIFILTDKAFRASKEVWFSYLSKLGFVKHPNYYNGVSFNSMQYQYDTMVFIFERLNIKDGALLPKFQNKIGIHDILRSASQENEVISATIKLFQTFSKSGSSVLVVNPVPGVVFQLYKSLIFKSISVIYANNYFEEYDKSMYAFNRKVHFIKDFNKVKSEFDVAYVFVEFFDDAISKYLQELPLKVGGRLIFMFYSKKSRRVEFRKINNYILNVCHFAYLLDEVWLEKKHFKARHEVRSLVKCQLSKFEHINKENLAGIVFLKIPDIAGDRKKNDLRDSKGFYHFGIEDALINSATRLNSNDNQYKLALNVLRNTSIDTVDFAASLCVLMYRSIERLAERKALDFEMSKMRRYIDLYLRNLDDSLKGNRWKISLSYVAGLSCLQSGDYGKGYSYLRKCASYEPSKVVPMIATKTLSSLILMANMDISNGRFRRAKVRFRDGIKVACNTIGTNWHLVIGDLDRPKEFGMIELAQVANLASMCAKGLNSLNMIKQSGSNIGLRYTKDPISLQKYNDLIRLELNQRAIEHFW